MSLRLLAGPFNLTDDQLNALTPHTVTPVCHYPGFGLMMKIDFPGLSSIALVTLDGIAQPITTQDIGGAGGFNPAGWMFDMVTGELVTNTGMAREKICLGLVPYTGKTFPAPGSGAFSSVSVSDRSLFVFATNVLTSSLGAEASWPAGGGTANVTSANVLPGRTGNEIYIGAVTAHTASNWGMFYDFVARQFTTQAFLLPDGTVASYWDVDSGVLVLITDTPAYSLSIYSLDVIPDSISAVTLQSGTVATGAIATYQAQVLGDRSDWSVGVLVDWSITSGDGELLDTQTTTGPDGFATARVFYPTTAAVSTVLKASVTC